MKRRRHTPEQAVRKVREGERMLGAGSDLVEVLRHLEITESTWYPASTSHVSDASSGEGKSSPRYRSIPVRTRSASSSSQRASNW